MRRFLNPLLERMEKSLTFKGSDFNGKILPVIGGGDVLDTAFYFDDAGTLNYFVDDAESEQFYIRDSE